jgi:heavy metal translocating P-type ATPase
VFFELTFLGIAAYQGITAAVRRVSPGASGSTPSPTRQLSPRSASASGARDRAERDHDPRFAIATVNLGVSAVALAVPALAPVVAGTAIAIGAPVFRSGVVGLLRERRVGNDLLVTLSVVALLASGHIGVMAMGSWFYFLGNRIQRRVKSRARLQLASLFLQTPRPVWVLCNGAEVSMPIEQVRRGDVVAVRAGEMVPIDGVVSAGQALVDEHLLTGESQPAEKDAGDRVLASTVVLSGSLQIRAEDTGADTTTARIAALLERSVDHRSEVQLKGERWADQAALPLLATAGAALLMLGPAPSVVVLTSGIGNRMRLLGPLGTLTHLNLAAGFGFLVKDGRALEQLRSIDTLVFDKTGTLTRNELLVRQVVPVAPLTEADVLRYAAVAERTQSHPIARTITARAVELALDVPVVDDRDYQIGYGIAVHCEGRLVQVGSANYLRREGIALDAVAALEQQARGEGHTIVLVAVEGVLGGAIELTAALRPGLAEMLTGLSRHGVTLTAIVSGDHPEPTRALADQLGVTLWYAEASPQRKAEIVAELQAAGRTVCFIGDGVNDSVAMKRADVSMSLQGASSFAMDAAQIVLMDPDAGLANLGRLFELAGALDRNLRNSLKIVIAAAAINVNGALFVPEYGVLTAYGIKQAGLAAGLGNAMLAPRGRFKPVRALPAPVKAAG